MLWSFTKQSNGKMTNLNVNILCTKKSKYSKYKQQFLIDKWWQEKSETTFSEVKVYCITIFFSSKV